MKITNKFEINQSKQGYVLTVKSGFRKTHLGIYKTEDEANNALLEAKADLNSFVSKNKASSGRSGTGKNYFKTKYGYYTAYISLNSKQIYLGNYKTEKEAKEIVELAKSNLEEAITKIGNKPIRNGKNYYFSEKDKMFQVIFHRKNIYYFIKGCKTENEAKTVVDLVLQYELEHKTLNGVRDYIKNLEIENGNELKEDIPNIETEEFEEKAEPLKNQTNIELPVETTQASEERESTKKNSKEELMRKLQEDSEEE